MHVNNTINLALMNILSYPVKTPEPTKKNADKGDATPTKIADINFQPIPRTIKLQVLSRLYQNQSIR